MIVPGSNWCGLEHAIDFIVDCDPKTVLDIGVGFGKWGFLSRMYLDVYKVRWHPRDWQVKIAGIEVFGDYVEPHQRYLYDRVVVGDILDIAPTLAKQGLVIACDVLEHLPKDRGLELVDHLRSISDSLLFGIPYGPGWQRVGTPENPKEAHISEWSHADLPWMDCRKFLAPIDLPYGMFTWRRKSNP